MLIPEPNLKKDLLTGFGLTVLNIGEISKNPDSPDQEFIKIGSNIAIITDYFNQNDLNNFYPKLIKSQFNADFQHYRPSLNGQISHKSTSGFWIIVAQIK